MLDSKTFYVRQTEWKQLSAEHKDN